MQDVFHQFVKAILFDTLIFLFLTLSTSGVIPADSAASGSTCCREKRKEAG